MAALKLISAGLTDRGQQRVVNEDTIFEHSGITEMGEYFGLYIVCDGLGGHRSGDVASQTAVRTVTRELQSILPPLPAQYMSSADINHSIWKAVQKANEEIRHLAENGETDLRGMGTTVTMALVIDDTVHVAHIGDSRLYLLRDEKLEQLTQDHTMAAALAEAGHIPKSEVGDHPRQNILTKALGRQKTIEADLMELPFLPGDKLLLCSDGFWKAFKESEETLVKRLNRKRRTADLCEGLLQEASELDGSDNISLIIVSAIEFESDRRHESVHRLRSERVPQAVAL